MQRTPELTVVPGAPASVAWVNQGLLTAGLAVTAGEEGFAELMCQDAFGNRIMNAAVGVAAELKHEGGKVCNHVRQYISHSRGLATVMRLSAAAGSEQGHDWMEG